MPQDYKRMFPGGIGQSFLTGLTGGAYQKGFLSGDQLRMQQEQEALRRVMAAQQIGQTVPGMQLTPDMMSSAGLPAPSSPVNIPTLADVQEQANIKQEERLDQREIKREERAKATMKQRRKDMVTYMNEIEKYGVDAPPPEDSMLSVEDMEVAQNFVNYRKQNKLGPQFTKELMDMYGKGMDIENNFGEFFNLASKYAGPGGLFSFKEIVGNLLPVMIQSGINKQQIRANMMTAMINKSVHSSDVIKAVVDNFMNNTPIPPELESKRVKQQAEALVKEAPALMQNLDGLSKRLQEIAASRGQVMTKADATERAMGFLFYSKTMTKEQAMMKFFSERAANDMSIMGDKGLTAEKKKQYAKEFNELWGLAYGDNDTVGAGMTGGPEVAAAAPSKKKPSAPSTDLPSGFEIIK